MGDWGSWGEKPDLKADRGAGAPLPRRILYSLINTPGVAGAILQLGLALIKPLMIFCILLLFVFYI